MDNTTRRTFSLMLVDDEPSILSALQRVFRKSPYQIHAAGNGVEAISILENRPVDAALVDLKMPAMDGIALLEAINKKWAHVRVLILTGHGGVPEAVAAMKLGAVDFLQKPLEAESIQARVSQLYRIWQLEHENRQLRRRIQFPFGFDQLVGNTSVMLNLKSMILQVAQSDASILIQGETGTGKELVARAIHHHSTRREHPFVPVDCGGISESVIASELFGHVKGAFTGAHESTQGLIRSAEKGTLFLDEVGELPFSMQVKLLRAIQEREVRPVGSSRSHTVDIRVLAATNRDLELEVEQGRFRQDLYYRLNVVVLTVAPLRDRVDDIPLLVRHFLEKFHCSVNPVKQIDDQALAALCAYEWPGNVRELENVIRRAIAIGRQDMIVCDDLPEAINNGHPPFAAEIDLPDTDTLVAYEKAAIRNALVKCGGHRKKAAQMLGIGEATLYRKLNKYALGL